MSETKWSPAFWDPPQGHETVVSVPAIAEVIQGNDHGPGVSAADARRIVAAINACAGISTEALEAGALGEALEALAGRSGKGHNIGTAGIVRCGECHHPPGGPLHFDDCSVGQALRALGRLP